MTNVLLGTGIVTRLGLLGSRAGRVGMIVAVLLVAQTGLVAGVAAASSVQKKIEKGNRLLQGTVSQGGKALCCAQ